MPRDTFARAEMEINNNSTSLCSMFDARFSFNGLWFFPWRSTLWPVFIKQQIRHNIAGSKIEVGISNFGSLHSQANLEGDSRYKFGHRIVKV